MTKKRVAILYGGRSVEHGVSINSAKNIYEFIDREKFEPVLFGISTRGTWHLCEGVSRDIEYGKPLSLLLDATQPQWKTEDGFAVSADVVFPVLHGTDGEDGSIQGLIKAMDVPMVGTGVLGSSLSMNKLIAKQLLQKSGLPVAPFVFCTFYDRKSLVFSELKEKIGLPFMVKATSLGSSIGISKVKNESDFTVAVEYAFRYDDNILLEEYIQGREIECAILGNDPPLASLPGEIIISSKYEFYSFDAKYVDPGAVDIHVPARLDTIVSDRIRELSVKAYQVLNCEDFARVDLFLRNDGHIFLNEVNTIPGFTNSSMYPMMWKERGVSFTELISRVIHLSLERFQRSKRVERDYQSSLKF